MELKKTANRKMKGDTRRELLSRKISELSLTIGGSRLETYLERLGHEMERTGISFRPKTYLSDEWGCPNRVPVIGIPFYLVDPDLCRLEGQSTGIEAEDEAEVMRYLRHEAGHAFNYAYRLYQTAEWGRLFGRFSQPYKEEYRPVPFSAWFVRHLDGWYAQKHPDDDFAETFAVWLTPNSDWRTEYAATPALAKLLYVEKVVQKYGRQLPVVADETLDTPVHEMTMTLDTWYRTCQTETHIHLTLPHILNTDLRRLFPATQGHSAVEVLRVHRQHLILEVTQWTGLSRKWVARLIDDILERVQSLGLKIDPDQTSAHLLKIAVFVTTLAMNYLCWGQFIEIKKSSGTRRVKQSG